MIWISWEKNQSLQEITSKILANFDPVVKKEQPDLVLVHGDTTTTFAGALAAFYNQVDIGHVEAGLRTWNKYSPYPEEMNRQMVGVLADMHFAPTENSKNSLLKEGKKEEDIPTSEKDELKDVNKKLDELKIKKEAVFAGYASKNKVVRQLIDLALLQNNMLKGEALNNFVKRSIELI